MLGARIGHRSLVRYFRQRLGYGLGDGGSGDWHSKQQQRQLMHNAKQSRILKQLGGPSVGGGCCSVAVLGHSAAVGQLLSAFSLIDCPPLASFRPMGTLYPPVPQMRLLLAPPCLRVLVATGQSSPPQSMERRRHSALHGVHPRGAPPQKRMRRAHSSFSLANFLLCARLRALSAGPIARSVKNCENHGRDQLNDLIHDGQSQRNVAKTDSYALGRCLSLSPFQDNVQLYLALVDLAYSSFHLRDSEIVSAFDMAIDSKDLIVSSRFVE
ncbi:hypothetical protein niasHT_014457 [Heterodera trifolii]|uniref:Uncharacterized protein n=1 Tax=Heterodera trifolii TaxID=157864 RepID=A0ABD2KZD9_9BILA